MVKIKTFRREEVISFLEEKLICGEADDNEMEMYQEFIWNNFINGLNYNTYRKLKKEMLNIWKGN